MFVIILWVMCTAGAITACIQDVWTFLVVGNPTRADAPRIPPCDMAKDPCPVEQRAREALAALGKHQSDVQLAMEQHEQMMHCLGLLADLEDQTLDQLEDSRDYSPLREPELIARKRSIRKKRRANPNARAPSDERKGVTSPDGAPAADVPEPRRRRGGKIA